MKKNHKEYEEQLDLFIERGVQVANKDYALNRLKHINYYKLKEFAIPFIDKTSPDFRYKNVTFEEIVGRFYIDKELRFKLLHATEKIELSFKNKVAFELGKAGSNNYLDFTTWVDKDLISGITQNLDDFKNKVEKIIEKESNENIKEYLDTYSDEDYPPIWMIIDEFDFGTTVFLYKSMKKELQNDIATCYMCNKDELRNWIGHINFVRNICAHNSKIIDIGYNYKPRLRKAWRKKVYQYRNSRQQLVDSNKIALTFFILKYLLETINKDYKIDTIFECMEKLIKGNESNAQKFGFKDIASLTELKNNNMI